MEIQILKKLLKFKRENRRWKKLNSINVFGEGSIVQGEYNKIRIFGEGEIRGKVKCKFLKIMRECGAYDFLDIEKLEY